jgi:hypothetical protein
LSLRNVRRKRKRKRHTDSAFPFNEVLRHLSRPDESKSAVIILTIVLSLTTTIVVVTLGLYALPFIIVIAAFAIMAIVLVCPSNDNSRENASSTCANA